MTELERNRTEPRRPATPHADTVDEQIVRPTLLLIWLGALREGPRASPEIILDAVNVRQEKRLATWLAYDPQRRTWICEQEAWADVEHLDLHYAKLDVPRILSAPAAVKTTSANRSTSAPTTALATSTSSPLIAGKDAHREGEGDVHHLLGAYREGL